MKNKLHISFAVVLLLLITQKNYAQVPVLGTTDSYALFSAIGAFNNVGASVIHGNVGTNVGAFTGFPPGTLVGQINVANPASVQAAIDVDVAYSGLAATTCGLVIGTTLGNGQSLTPNVYCLGAASLLNDTLILDGQGKPNSLFIFKINGALSNNTFAYVELKGGASACNVYWQINGAFSLGANAHFAGTILANGAINLGPGSSLDGRGLTREGAISVSNAVVTVPSCCLVRLIIKKEVCPNDSTGNLTTVVNGIGQYSYLWSNGSTTKSIPYYDKGVYTVSVTGGVCDGTVLKSKRIVTLKPIIFLQTRSEPTCATCCDGAVYGGSATGGTPPYTYLWNDGNTNASRTDFCVGKYVLVITDANGCTATIQKHFGKNLKVGDEDESAVVELQVSPNSGNGFANLSLETMSDQTLSFTIVDLVGKVLFSEQLATTKGVNSIPLDFNALPSGIYFLNFKNENVSKNIRFVKN